MDQALSMAEAERRIESLEGCGAPLSLASLGKRIWNEPCRCWRESGELFCDVKDPQTRENVSRNPRVSFSIVDEALGRMGGNGIAIPDRSKDACAAWSRVRIVPYRIVAAIGPAGKRDPFVLERERLAWRLAEGGPQSSAGSRMRGLGARLAFAFAVSRGIALPLSIAPIAIGAMLALPAARFDIGLFLLTLLGGVCAHLGTNLVSDYNDFKKGVDTPDALSSHPGALVREELLPESVLIAGLVLFAVTAFCGGLIAAVVGWPILLFGLAGILGGYSYTGGFLSYKYRGLGELMILVLMGPLLVVGAYFVEARDMAALPLALSIPLGLLVGSVTLANNLRDMKDDRRAKVRTLPMMLGPRDSKRLYYAMIGLPYVVTALVAVLVPWTLPTLAVFLSLPKAWAAFKALRDTADDEDDIRSKASERRYPLKSIQLHLWFSVLLAAGLAIGLLFLHPSFRI